MLILANLLMAADLANNLDQTHADKTNLYVGFLAAQQFTTTATDYVLREVHLKLYGTSTSAGTYDVEIWSFNTTTNKPTSKVATVETDLPIPTSTDVENTVVLKSLNITLTASTKYYVVVKCTALTAGSFYWSYTASTTGTGFPSYYSSSLNSGSSWTTPGLTEPQRMRIVGVVPSMIVLNSFAAKTQMDHVTIQWETGSETDNAGFHLWRSESKDGEYQQITGFIIPSQGGATWGADYEYHDFSIVPSKTYFYKLQDIDYAGKHTFHGPVASK